MILYDRRLTFSQAAYRENQSPFATHHWLLMNKHGDERTVTQEIYMPQAAEKNKSHYKTLNKSYL